MFSLDAKKPGLYDKVDSKAMSLWVDSVYNSLTPRERISQLFMPTIIPQSDVVLNDITQYVLHDKVGGLILSKGSAATFATSVNAAQQQATIPTRPPIGIADKKEDNPAPAMPAGGMGGMGGMM